MYAFSRTARKNYVNFQLARLGRALTVYARVLTALLTPSPSLAAFTTAGSLRGARWERNARSITKHLPPILGEVHT